MYQDFKSGFGIIGMLLIVAVVVLVGGGAYYYVNKISNFSSGTPSISKDQDTPPNFNALDGVQPPISGSLSLSEVAKRGGDYKCSAQVSHDQSSLFQSVSYISGNRFYMDISSSYQGRTSHQYAIDDGSWVYIWGTDVPGTKTLSNKKSGAADPFPLLGAYGSAANGGSYSCESWSIDESNFVPPSNINFNSIGF